MTWLDLLEALRTEGFVVVFKLDGERSTDPYTVVVSGGALGTDAFRRDGASLETLAREAVTFVRSRVLTVAQARAVALAQLSARQAGVREPLALLDDLTREEPFGWVFFWNSARFAQTRKPGDGLPGSGGFVVERGSGVLHEVVGPLERFLRRFS
ncbi:MAG: YrhB domain-containing protein [Myxococcota bacterium]